MKKRKFQKNVFKVEQEAKVSPAARKIANEAKIDLDKIKGTGKNGIILKEDIMDLMGSKPAPQKEKLNMALKRE